MFASKDELFTRPSGSYTIGKSVRTRASASGSFNRTFVAGNTKTWTWSAWVKRGAISASNQWLFALTASQSYICFNSSENILISFYSTNSSTGYTLTTSQVFRDPSAWYHVVLAVDTTQATNTNRIKLYVNGVQITAFSSASYPAQNDVGQINTAAVHRIASYDGSLYFFDGYQTENNFIDGQQLTPSSFGSTNTTTGVWQPAKYTGTYGTNGFYLNFSSNGTSAALGTDFSGNSNTWTVNNISVTAGTTYDSMTDVPTLTSATAANYAVINPLNPLTAAGYTAPTSTNGNLTFAQSSGQMGAIATIPVTFNNKFYWETTLATADINIGAMDVSVTYGVYAHVSASSSVAQIRSDGSTVQTLGTYFAIGDVIGIAYDDVGKTIQFYKNNATYGTAVTLSATAQTSTLFPIFFDYSSSNHITSADSVNFGQQGFKYTPPTGYVALNTYNLPTSTITNGAAYMAASLYTGTGSAFSVSNAVNGTSFQPDFVWIKGRSSAYNHALFDSIRGARDVLQSQSTSAEILESAGTSMTSFDSGGFSLGTNGGSVSTNVSSQTFVGWQWKAGGTSSSNTNGSITSTVSAGATQGFSVVTYTGTGANATVGHGLGVAPSMIILKQRNAVDYWVVWQTTLGSTGYLLLNSTNGSSTAATYWNSTLPTSSVFSLGSDSRPNGSGTTYVAYCFAAVKGFSAFGSYTGNGSTDGPFVYCGFRPRYVLVKRSDSTGDWNLHDTARDSYNVADKSLFPNVSNAEATPYYMDIVSNGFKIRDSGSSMNTSSGTYIYACFAENPFKNALAR